MGRPSKTAYHTSKHFVVLLKCEGKKTVADFLLFIQTAAARLHFSLQDSSSCLKRKNSDMVEEARDPPGDGIHSSNEVRVSLLDPDIISEQDCMMLTKERSEDVGVRAWVTEASGGNTSGVVSFLNAQFEGWIDLSDSETDASGNADKQEDTYKSFLSEFDDYVASERNGCSFGTSRALKYGFEVDDMVWGKVKSHPWWPGHIISEAFASPSVRRTRREGHVLVAFFGDSSYGWFDPSELIPFDCNFAEKSQQTNSRNFQKAVEEAIDEAGKRSGLGLVCKCRNSSNFRHTKVQGYFVVDIPDYEPYGVYSASLIKKARDSFRTSGILSFLKEIALAPREVEQTSLDFVKNRAKVAAFRKAVFEEFDETYAEAFGGKPLRTPHKNVAATDKELPRAPLSGPLVIAETLGGGKSSKKPFKSKDLLKKERYLFKRRDEKSDARDAHVIQGQTSSSAPFAYIGGSFASEAGDYVLQKRASPTPRLQPKDEQPGLISGEVDEDLRSPLENEIFISANKDTKTGCLVESGIPASSQQDVKQTRPNEGDSQANELRFSPAEGNYESCQVPDDPTSVHTSLKDARSLKTKVLKRPMGELSADNSSVVEIKKKKNKVFCSETVNNPLLKRRMASGMIPGPNSVGKSNQAGVIPKKDEQLNNQRKDGGVPNSLSGSVGSSLKNSALEVSQLVKDLHGLALNPYHGFGRNIPRIVCQFFLRFRSLVYQKSLGPSPSTESGLLELPFEKSSSAALGSSENSRRLVPPKLLKSSMRPDDPTISGRKRLPSDRQEEIAAKRLKKMNHLKSLATEKKTIPQRSTESQRSDPRDQTAVGSSRPQKPHASVKRIESPVKLVEPTMLVMKFPQDTTLPSPGELKARFGRFGPLNQDAMRIFWRSSTCRVVYKYKHDAQAAYKYAMGNKSLFGNISVRYLLREVEGSAAEASDFDTSMDNNTSRSKDLMAERAAAPRSQASSIQLKSCLKKTNGDETSQATTTTVNNSRDGPRVKFVLGGEETTNTVVVANTSAHHGSMDYNSKNIQKAIPCSTFLSSSTLPPLLPLPPQYAKVAAQRNNLQAPLLRTTPYNHNCVAAVASSTTVTVDISQQMLSLLTKCSDVVNSVAELLGYVPYHPL